MQLVNMIILSIWSFWVLYWIFIYESFKQTFISGCWEKHSCTNYSKDDFILFLSFLPRELLFFPSKGGELLLLSAKANFHKKEVSQLQNELFSLVYWAWYLQGNLRPDPRTLNCISQPYLIQPCDFGTYCS